MDSPYAEAINRFLASDDEATAIPRCEFTLNAAFRRALETIDLLDLSDRVRTTLYHNRVWLSRGSGSSMGSSVPLAVLAVSS